jgi:hypothetical protein
MGNVTAKLAAAGAAVALVVVACGNSAAPTSTVPPLALEPVPTLTTPIRPADDPPLPDTSIHSVPLEDVVFDTFIRAERNYYNPRRVLVLPSGRRGTT